MGQLGAVLLCVPPCLVLLLIMSLDSIRIVALRCAAHAFPARPAPAPRIAVPVESSRRWWDRPCTPSQPHLKKSSASPGCRDF